MQEKSISQWEKERCLKKVTSFLFFEFFSISFLLLIPVLFSSQIIMEVIFCENYIKSIFTISL